MHIKNRLFYSLFYNFMLLMSFFLLKSNEIIPQNEKAIWPRKLMISKRGLKLKSITKIVKFEMIVWKKGCNLYQ